MVNSSKKSGLGRTLQRAQKLANDRRNPRKSAKHTTESNLDQDDTKINLRSVTAQTNLDEFFEEAALAGKQFITERRNLVIINENESIEQDINKLEDIDVANCLSVPRRPAWDASTTPEVLAEREKLSFLAWRRKLAKLQENAGVIMTPFEKNLEVWRQLWRVIERSDIVVQILDCRNPMLYLCDDLINYVNEEFDGKKMNLILLNKADFLTVEQRKLWSSYFKSRGIKIIFFSALWESEKAKKSDQSTQQEADQTDSNEEASVSSNEDYDEYSMHEKFKSNFKLSGYSEDEENRVLDKFELLDVWQSLLGKLESSKGFDEIKSCVPNETDSEQNCSPPHIPTVGLVGYPNVGKSSTINALLSAKRVAVSATPGKTKHFQTFQIDRNMVLCDCPGLVFPNFVSSKAEMIINGILPIDQMKDSLGPVRIIVSRIPKGYFEEIYGLAFEQDSKQNIVAEDLLNALGFMRGYMTARGLPDISRAARRVCKDYINGKIIYCEPPPDCDKTLFSSHSKLAEVMKNIEVKRNDPNSALRITERQRRLMAQAKGTDITSREFDERYFKAKTSNIHIKGLPGIGNMTMPIGSQIGIKEPKLDRKHKKREKLRRVFKDLDI